MTPVHEMFLTGVVTQIIRNALDELEAELDRTDRAVNDTVRGLRRVLGLVENGYGWPQAAPVREAIRNCRERLVGIKTVCQDLADVTNVVSQAPEWLQDYLGTKLRAEGAGLFARTVVNYCEEPKAARLVKLHEGDYE